MYKYALTLFASLMMAAAVQADIDHIKLPSLGDGISGIVSKQQERALGDAWLRMFRARANTISDPLLLEYTENLVRRMANYSELEDKSISLVIVDSPAINAFAVPGGVMGINNGLFLNASGEQEFASVVAHELGHLSQRHFARNVENAQARSMPTMAGLLAGMLILAAGGGDAGVATIAATQAAAAESQLAHSRLHEIEADRSGMDTMVRAGMEPLAMARMFETMLDAKRFSGKNYPEFLLTHPLTERRVSDAKTRARNYSIENKEKSLDYHLMQSRVRMHFAHSPGEAITIFKAEMANTLDPVLHTAYRYGLVLAYTESRQFEQAQQELNKLLQDDGLRLVYQLAQADIYSQAQQHAKATRHLENMLKITPNSHAVTMALARSYLQVGEAKAAANLLEQHSRRRPNTPSVWYELAEAKGLAGDILGVHTARGEYFLLTGILDEAGRQLNYALNIARGDFMETAKLEQRLRYLEELRNIKL